MAWPKLRNRRSPAPSPDAEQSPARSGGSPGQSGGPSPAAEPAPASGLADPDSGDGPSFLDWAQADDPAGLDDLDDGMPEAGLADDGATDVDPGADFDVDSDADSGFGPRADSGAGPGAGAGAERHREPVVTPVGDATEPKVDGIGQHLGSLAHLSANPRMRLWQWRVAIAIVAGVVFGYLLNDWRWGLTFAVLAAIAHTIYWSKKGLPVPRGGRLTPAQKRTIGQLASLDRKGYRAMHMLPIPGSDEQIDHLVIGPAGVFAIDSEDWDKRLPVRTSSHLKLWHGPYIMTDRLEHASWEAEQASKVLSAATGSKVDVRPAMAVYGPKIPWDVATIRDVDTFSGPQLRKYLRKRARARDAHRLSSAEIERIDKAAHAVFGVEAPIAGRPPR